jgi:hypothetical protein
MGQRNSISTIACLGGLGLALAGWYLASLAGQALAGAARLLVWAGAVALVAGLATGLVYLGLRSLVSLAAHSLLALEQVRQARHKTADLALARRKAAAEARKLEREAELTIITAPLDHQLHISDLNPHSLWLARHLEPRLYAPATQAGRPPQPWEMGLWLAAHNHSGGAVAEAGLAGAGAPLPERIDLADLLPGMRGALKNIILGARLDKQGRLRPVSAPMYRLCHIGAAGATDSGKSNFGRAIAYQVFTAAEPVQVVVSDLKATTFKVFAGSERLLYPIIHTPTEFVAVMAELSDEMKRRKELFKPYPTVETLMDYNTRSGVEPLPFIVIFVDEITNLFMTRETQAITLEMLREARAFGMYFMAMGQSWSHREMDTSIRQQFRTGLHFGTNDPASSRMIVNSSDAVKITTPGRALASLPFGMSPGPIEIQTPYLDTAAALQALQQFGLNNPAPPSELRRSRERISPPAGVNGSKTSAPPAAGVPENAPTPKQAKVLELWDSGVVDKKVISRQVYGVVGGNQYQLIEATLSKFGRL